MGLDKQSSGDPEAAITHFQEALRLQPDYAEAQYRTGASLQVLGRLRRPLPTTRPLWRSSRTTSMHILDWATFCNDWVGSIRPSGIIKMHAN